MNYQEYAARTLNGNVEFTDLERLSNFLIGLAGETIELGQLLTDPIGLNRREKTKNEAGDCRWYIAAVHSALDISESDTEPKREEIEDACYVTSLGHAFENLLNRVGTLLEFCKKQYFHKHEQEKHVLYGHLIKLRAAWIAFVITAGFLVDEVEQANIQKLMKRYPQGFSTAASIARVDTVKE